MTLVEGDDYQRLWLLVGELSQQLTTNREVAAQLQARVDELKGQALHNNTGYALRRFNLDISKEKFESNLEKLNASLVVENQTLAHENKQLNLLLREYEQTLETIMGRFRSFSHATQSHTLQLTSHYESLLSQAEEDQSSRDLSESTAVSSRLSEMGSLVRLAMRTLDGEVSTSPSPTSPASGAAGPGSISQSTSDHTESRGYGSAPSADPKWHGTGGYTGTAGDPDAARSAKVLEDTTEEERLRYENAQLRELLKIATEMPELPAEPPTSAQLSLGQPRKGRRSSSVTAPADPSSPPTRATETYTIGSPSSADSVPRSPLRARAAPMSPTGRATGPTLIPPGGAGGPPQLDGPPPPISSMSTSPVRAIPAALVARAGSISPSKTLSRPLFEDDELELPVDELGAASTEGVEGLPVSLGGSMTATSQESESKDEPDSARFAAVRDAIPDELDLPDLPSQSIASSATSDDDISSSSSPATSDASQLSAETAQTVDSLSARTASDQTQVAATTNAEGNKALLGLDIGSDVKVDQEATENSPEPV
ncbi:Suppressor of IKBKE 1 [Ceraceosorus bombacis]|uniref:Suppressor of IKBKE 1 n=1 Tax=Ceraceosorus bombacis TaxID=401625 RepID=A0A0P1BEJ7_9BASI|nr:Suppressor of IKBKE 1 [Ceraceosorus bombacis]